GSTRRSSSKPEPPQVDPKPEPKPSPAAPSGGLPSWMDQDESLLDYGKPKASKPASAEASAGKPAEAPKPASLPSWMDQGDTPQSGSKPFALPKDKPAKVEPAADRSIGNIPGGGETMLDMGLSKPAAASGETARSSSKPFALPKDKPADVPMPADRSIGNIPGGGETM